MRTFTMSHRSGCTFHTPNSSASFTITTLETHCASSSMFGHVKLKLLRAYLFSRTMAAETLQ